MIWAPKGSTHSIPIKQVAPRISMIMGISNTGDIYATFSQVNTDSKIMGIYYKELVKTLDAKDVNWRRTHLIVHDGAKYS